MSPLKRGAHSEREQCVGTSAPLPQRTERLEQCYITTLRYSPLLYMIRFNQLPFRYMTPKSVARLRFASDFFDTSKKAVTACLRRHSLSRQVTSSRRYK